MTPSLRISQLTGPILFELAYSMSESYAATTVIRYCSESDTDLSLRWLVQRLLGVCRGWKLAFSHTLTVCYFPMHSAVSLKATTCYSAVPDTEGMKHYWLMFYCGICFTVGSVCRWIRMQHPYVPQPVIGIIRRLFGFVPLLVYGAHFSAVPFKVCCISQKTCV